MVDDRSDNQLWEKGNKQQIIDDIIVLCLSTERVDQKAINWNVKKEIPIGRMICCRGMWVPAIKFTFLIKKSVYFSNQANRRLQEYRQQIRARVRYGVPALVIC